MNSKLTHMPSSILNWNEIKNFMKPINELSKMTLTTIQNKSGQTQEQLYRKLMENTAQINSLKTPDEIVKKIFSLWGISDVPKAVEYQFLESVGVDFRRGGGHFSLSRYNASITLFLPMPLEEKLKVLFSYLDLDGDLILDEKELHDGIRDFFIGIIHMLEKFLQPGVAEATGIKDLNLDGVKIATEQLKLVYTDEKINEIKNKCIAEADTNKDGKISFSEWTAWFPNGAPDAFGHAKVLFDP